MRSGPRLKKWMAIPFTGSKHFLRSFRREAVKDEMAAAGLELEDLREFLRKANAGLDSPAGDQ
jgi:hypothetical protein